MKIIRIICFLIFFVVNLIAQKVYAQDTSLFHINTREYTPIYPDFTYTPILISAPDRELSHDSSDENVNICKEYSQLINAEPAKNNYKEFYSTACALWECNRLLESEKMFLKIMSSKQPFYTGTYYHSSDITGDTSTNNYGYGICTSNYKNEACRYLARIYVEEKKYDLGLKYLHDADQKYKVVYTCGTGDQWDREQMMQLYELCYDGQGNYDSIISLYLPFNFSLANETFIHAIKKKYTRVEINNYLQIAEKSITCVIDSFQSTSYTITLTEKFDTTDVIKYTSGKAKMLLFDKWIDIYPPVLKDGEIITREWFVKDFKESAFYKSLTE